MFKKSLVLAIAALGLAACSSAPSAPHKTASNEPYIAPMPGGDREPAALSLKTKSMFCSPQTSRPVRDTSITLTLNPQDWAKNSGSGFYLVARPPGQQESAVMIEHSSSHPGFDTFVISKKNKPLYDFAKKKLELDVVTIYHGRETFGQAFGKGDYAELRRENDVTHVCKP